MQIFMRAELAEVTGLLSAAAAVRASPLWPEGVVVDVDDGRLWVSANLSFRPGRTVEGEAAAFGALLGAEDWRR